MEIISESTSCKVIPSRYWNMVHGARREQVQKDKEGLQIMRVQAKIMAWFLKLKESGIRNGVELPERENRIFTNYVR